MCRYKKTRSPHTTLHVAHKSAKWKGTVVQRILHFMDLTMIMGRTDRGPLYNVWRFISLIAPREHTIPYPYSLYRDSFIQLHRRALHMRKTTWSLPRESFLAITQHKKVQ